jgi:hypothetical protein
VVTSDVLDRFARKVPEHKLCWCERNEDARQIMLVRRHRVTWSNSHIENADRVVVDDGTMMIGTSTQWEVLVEWVFFSENQSRNQAQPKDANDDCELLHDALL